MTRKKKAPLLLLLLLLLVSLLSSVLACSFHDSKSWGRKSNWPVGSWALLGLGRVRDFFSHPRQHSAGEVISLEEINILAIKGGMDPPRFDPLQMTNIDS